MNSLKTLRISQIGLILVAVPLACELIFVLTLLILLSQAEAETQNELRARTISEQANIAIVQVMRNLGSLQQYYKSSTNRDEEKHWLSECGEADKQARAAFDKLHTLLRNPEQKAMVDDTAHLYKTSSDLIRRLQHFDKHDIGAVHAVEMFGARKQLNDNFYEMLSKLNQLLAQERQTERESPALQSAYRHLVEGVLFAAVVFNIFVAVALARYFSRFITQRLSRINENTVRLAKGDKLLQALDGNDEIAHVDSVFHDMANKLKEADQMKQEFVSMLSHDLRTPLTSLQALLTVLDAGVLGEISDAARKRVRGAEGDVARLISLINDLLDIERMEAGKFELAIQPVRLATIFERSFESVRAIADSRRIEIKIQSTADSVMADTDRIVQVVVNILSNAIKFSPDDSAVEISVVPREAELEVRITDSGRGIPADKKAAIFGRFLQVERDDAVRMGGSGLGLAICKTIVEQHGGTIGVESEVDRGSTFWFRLKSATVATPIT